MSKSGLPRVFCAPGSRALRTSNPSKSLWWKLAGLVVVSACSATNATSPTGTEPTSDAGALTDAMQTDPVRTEPARSDAGQTDGVRSDAGQTVDVPPASLGEISAQELHAALAAKDFLLIDVHTPYAGTIPGTDARIVYTDVAAIAQYIGPALDTKVVLTCASGHMSTVAGKDLASRGYRAIRQLTGGFSAWTSAGYTLDRSGAGGS